MAGNVIAVVFDADTPIHWRCGSNVHQGHARPGTITIVPEGEEGHWEMPGGVDGIQMVVSSGHLDALSGIVGRNRRGSLRPQLTKDDPPLFHLFATLSEQFAAADSTLNLLIDELMDRICMHLLIGGEKHQPHRRLRAFLLDSQVKRVEDYLHCNLHRDIKLEELAQLVGHDRTGFSVAFRNATGSTPYERLTYLRMMRAKEIMANSANLTISEIAGVVGYRTTSGFRRAFKQVFGVATTAHRNRH